MQGYSGERSRIAFQAYRFQRLYNSLRTNRVEIEDCDEFRDEFTGFSSA